MNIQGYYAAFAGYGISTQMQQQLAAEQAAQNRAEVAKENREAVEAKDNKAGDIKDLKDIWKELGGKHNVKGMTLESMQTVSLTLYNNDKITIHEHTVMTFSMGKDAAEEQPDPFLTEADEEGKRNWIAEFQARLREHRQAGDEDAAAMDDRILGILERLEAAARGGLNVTV